MAAKDRWGSMFSKAKDWVEKKVEETTTSDKRKSERLNSEADALERQMRDEAQTNALRQAIPGLDRAMEHQEERARAETAEREAKQRAAREASFSEASWVQLTGEVSGRVEGLSVRRDVWEDSELIALEPVDPVPLVGGSFGVVTFVIPRGFAVGRHDLAETYTDSEGFELYVRTDEPYYWAPEFGPGWVNHNPNGSLRFEMTMENAGSGRVVVSGLVAPA
jgi:hypothetical protein